VKNLPAKTGKTGINLKMNLEYQTDLEIFRCVEKICAVKYGEI